MPNLKINIPEEKAVSRPRSKPMDIPGPAAERRRDRIRRKQLERGDLNVWPRVERYTSGLYRNTGAQENDVKKHEPSDEPLPWKTVPKEEIDKKNRALRSRFYHQLNIRPEKATTPEPATKAEPTTQFAKADLAAPKSDRRARPT